MKYISETVHNHLLRMPFSKWADSENVTGANKLASPRRVIGTVAPTVFAFIRHYCCSFINSCIQFNLYYFCKCNSVIENIL